MIDNPIIPRDMIFQTFWSKLSHKKATNVFHVTKGNIHDALGFELIEHSGQFYNLTEAMILTYDVGDFHEFSQNGERLLDESQLRIANQIYKHTFLQDTEMAWIHARRQLLELQYCDMLRTLADLQMNAGNLDVALGTGIRILSEYPADENVAEKIIDLYLKRNQPCDARAIYEGIKNALRSRPFSARKELDDLGNLALSRCP
jgi:DNA-binding SARP family transcriptional activator